jgi:sugar phosphate isomerase/epimerase
MSLDQSRRSFLTQSAAALGASWVASPGATVWAGEKPFRGKFSICNETFGDWAFDRAFAFAAECGYQGTEIAPFTIAEYVTDVSAQRRQEIRKQAEAAGLQVVGLHWLLAKTKGFHLTSPYRDVRRKTAEYLGELARFCADLGGKLIVFGSPQQRNLAEGVSRDDGMKYAAEVFTETLPVLEKTDVRLAVEPLSHKITNFLSTAAEAVELVRKVNDPRCRLILDCLAMASEPTPIPKLIHQFQADLIHFHANDPNSQGPGFGDLDFGPIFQALREIDFANWVSVEVFDYKPGPERLARESIDYMKKCLAATS